MDSALSMDAGKDEFFANQAMRPCNRRNLFRRFFFGLNLVSYDLGALDARLRSFSVSNFFLKRM